MFNNKIVNLIISILVAIGLWAYVVVGVDPQTGKTFNDVPIQIVNLEELEDDGLALESTGKLNVNMRITGKRSDINNLEKEDVSASIDLSKCRKGNNRIAVDITSPKAVNVEETEPAHITVNATRAKTKKVDVVATFRNLSDDKEAGNITVFPQQVNVIGADSRLDTVDHVDAVVNLSKKSGNYVEDTFYLIPVTKKHKEVEYVSVADDEAYVTANIYQIKTVNLKTGTTGSVDKSVALVRTDVPEQITIKGDADALANITEVTVPDVDLSGIKKNTKVKLEPDLPYGVYVADKDKDLSMEIVVEKK